MTASLGEDATPHRAGTVHHDMSVNVTLPMMESQEIPINDDDDSHGEALNARLNAASTTAPLPTPAAYRRGPHQERIEAQLAAQSSQLAAQMAQMAVLLETVN